jgi:hypothetical protein
MCQESAFVLCGSISEKNKTADVINAETDQIIDLLPLQDQGEKHKKTLIEC